jgi:flagellar capping protein FliD
VLVVAVLTLTGCTGAAGRSGHPPPTTTPVHQTLAQRYTELVSDGNHRLENLSKQLNQSNGNVVAIQSRFRQVSSTYRQVATSVQALPFPPAMHNDVAAMVTALNTLSHDATQGAESVTPDEFNLIFTNLAAHEKIEVAANTTVNHDLGIASIN